MARWRCHADWRSLSPTESTCRQEPWQAEHGRPRGWSPLVTLPAPPGDTPLTYPLLCFSLPFLFPSLHFLSFSPSLFLSLTIGRNRALVKTQGWPHGEPSPSPSPSPHSNVPTARCSVPMPSHGHPCQPLPPASVPQDFPFPDDGIYLYTFLL